MSDDEMSKLDYIIERIYHIETKLNKLWREIYMNKQESEKIKK
tara:strand:+ start:3315 stop:3443 length:129 start_codon:yes stop_codon:yes gene_type:complete